MSNHLSVWDVISMKEPSRAGRDGNFANHDDSRSVLRNRNSHKLDKHAVLRGSGVLDSLFLIFEHGHSQDIVTEKHYPVE